MVIGAMLQAAELGIVIMVDGFIMTNCILAASKLYPEVLHYAISDIVEMKQVINYYSINIESLDPAF